MWPFIIVVLLQAGLAGISLYTLSAVRAYVGGESLWSKGQKDAVYYLGLYVDSGREAYFRAYQAAVAIPIADQRARSAMEKPILDRATATQGFLEGDNHPDDIGGLIWLFRNFGEVSYLKRSIEHWIAGDVAVARLTALADDIRADLKAGRASDAAKAKWRENLYTINSQIAVLSRDFSQSLGDGSRFILRALLAANILTACLLIVIGVWRTRSLLVQRTAFKAALGAEKERAATTLASIGQAVFTTDLQGRLDYMNAAAERLTGLACWNVIGRPLGTLFDIEEARRKTDTASLVHSIAAGETVQSGGVPWTLVRRDGSRVAISLTGAPLSADGATAGIVIVLHDMTQEQDYIAQLSWQASHDALTNLINRREFEQRASEALSGASERGCALVYLDLDQFKIVNDTCGHAAGDKLLRQFADLLTRRQSAGDLVARFGGDEFGLLMVDCALETAATAAEALRQAVEDMAFVWNGRSFTITASMGLVHIADPHLTLEEAFSAADVACYLAKEKGRNRVQQHTASDGELQQKFSEMAWVQRIRDALDEDRFFLEAQEIRPLVAAYAGERHVEVLLRLRDEHGGVVPPAAFVPAAERYGLMPLVDRWVVRHALATLAQRSLRRADPISTCSINLSGATLGDTAFTQFLTEQFRLHGIAPSMICFEITETAAIASLENASCFVAALKRIGCRFSLDDFGAGMSSFGYLKHLPVDFVKIDGTFVRDILRDPIDRAMVETINRIGQLMGKRTIAEFVESQEIADCLAEMGVDYAQGFGIARPTLFDANSALGFGQDEPRRVVA